MFGFLAPLLWPAFHDLVPPWVYNPAIAALYVSSPPRIFASSSSALAVAAIKITSSIDMCLLLLRIAKNKTYICSHTYYYCCSAVYWVLLIGYWKYPILLYLSNYTAILSYVLNFLPKGFIYKRRSIDKSSYVINVTDGVFIQIHCKSFQFIHVLFLCIFLHSYEQ